jgi:hypothetical protein
MNTTTKTILTAILITLVSGIAAADIETGWDYSKRNPLPDESYIRFDFDGTSFNSYAGVVNFIHGEENKWDFACIGERGYHIYPRDFFYNYNHSTDPPTRTQVDYIYIVNGKCGAQPVIWRCTNVKCEWWPGSEGMIEFPSGASDVSFLVSTGKNLEMLAYDKNAKLIGTSGVAHANIGRVPPNPSEFTRVSFKTSTPIIHAVIIRSDLINFWIMDDLVIGGLTFPDPPKDYNYAAERMKELIGAKFLEYGLGYDLVMGQFLTAEQIKDEIADPCWNPDTKELFFDVGIYDENAIVWAFNVDEDVVNWGDINNQAKHDFTVHVEYGEQRPGDVFFLDYDADGCYDEVGIFIEPQNNPDTGALEDIIRIIPEAGVHYESSEYIHALYGGTTIDSFMDCMRLPDHPKGGHSPYPKIPSKFFI